MAMDQIVPKAVLLPENFHIAGEIAKMIIDGQLLYLFFPCLEMDQSRILPQFYNLIVCRLMHASIDVDGMTSPPELASELSDVDTHTPCIFPAYLAEGTTVNAKHRYLQFNSFLPNPTLAVRNLVQQSWVRL